MAPTRAARLRLAPWIICCSIPLSGFATPFLAPRVPELDNLDSVGTWFLAARMEKPQKGKRQLITFIHVVTARGRMHHACCMLSREIEIERLDRKFLFLELRADEED